MNANVQDRPAAIPTRILFDSDWLFHLGDVETGQAQALDDGQWRKLNVPHDWSIEGRIAQDNPIGPRGGFYPGGIGWYRKRFDAPEAWAGKRVAIEMDGVYWHSDVWINGHHLGHRPNGYVSLHYDLTEHLTVPGPNVLAVRVDNSRQPNGRWYTGSGIYRHVRLTVTDRLRLAHWGTTITTPAITDDAATVATSTVVRNETEAAGNITLRSTVLDATGLTVATAEKTAEIPAGAEHRFDHSVVIADPAMWSPETPNLYTLRNELLRAGVAVDAADTPFGVRSAVFDSNRGLLLNGVPYKMQGVCEHHDAGCVGAAVPDAVLARRLRLLKDMGCNAIRTSHNPPSPALLEMCDRTGFLVIDEGFDEWATAKTDHGYNGELFETWWHRDVIDWIARDRNHPCVILWSIGNEVRDQFTELGVKIARRLVDAIHRIDPTRPVTCGCNWQADDSVWIATELDVVGINGGGGGCFQYAYYHEGHPEWQLYASEVPHTLQTRGVYQSVTNYRNPDLAGGIQETHDFIAPEVFGDADPNYRSSYDNAYVRINARDSWKNTRDTDYIAGEFRWSGFDYLGETLGWPRRCWNFGIIDLCGFPKDHYYFYQSQWTDEPMVHVLPHWTWPGKEGVTLPVVAYSNCEEVELFVNGESLGRESMASKMDLNWLVPYQPGTLKVVGYNGGQPVAAKQFATAGPAAAVRLSADRKTIDADGRDVVHVTAEIVDAAGNMVPHADDRVRFDVTGPGTIIGVDSGDPCDHDSTKADNRKAFFGLALAIVQSTGVAGSISVAANADGLQGEEAAIDCTER